MHRFPPSKPYALFGAVLALLLGLPGTALAQSAPPPLLPAPPAAKAAEPSLVDKLLDIISNKKLPRIDIPPPAMQDPIPEPPEPATELDGTPKKQKASGPGIEIGQSFIPIYSFDRSEDEESPPVLPFFSTAPINKVQKNIQTLVVMIHDQSREAAKAFAYARSAQEEAIARHPEWNADASFIFAPQFLNSEDVAAHAPSWPDRGAALLRWVNASWVIGGDSVTPDQKGIWQSKKGVSSYTAMDFMLLSLARPKLFPELQKVVIAGTSGGADFVQRYAALGIAPSVLMDEGIEVRFVAAQTQRFLYMDNQRLVPHRDDPLTAKIESDAFAPTRPEACRPMNSFPYGLDDLPAYGRKNAVNEIRLNYSAKRIIYLAGAGATLPIHETTPDACALNAQGGSVRQRNEIFFASLHRIYGDEVDRMQKMYLLPDINEDGLALWRSACGGSALFGDGACTPGDVGGKAMQILR